jgi:hypothetical protein
MTKHNHGAGHDPSALGEKLLAGGFRGICLAMRAAAQCCGIDTAASFSGLPAEPGRSLVDFRALSLCGSIPLGEIAAAESEWR